MNSLTLKTATALTILISITTANAAVVFEFVAPRGYGGTDVSGDGSVVVGNVVGDGSFETFRWTQPTGAVRLGRATVPVTGGGAGSPDVSWDGNRVSATILADDITENMGVWENGTWTWPTQLPPNATIVDNARSDAWGLSGDGNVAVGLYWKTQPGGSARGLSWRIGDPGVALPSSGVNPVSSRANGTNYDGSVVVGWQDYNGPWKPAVWRDGAQTILSPDAIGCEARATSADGSIIVGDNTNAVFSRREAARWVLQGGQYVEQTLGVLPGTPNSFQGRAWASDISADGSIIVGTNRFFDNGPFSDGTGFIWTQATGMVDIVTYLGINGIVLDPLFDIKELSAISADGNTILGLGRWTDTFDLQTFRVVVPEPASLALVSALGLLLARRRHN